MALSLTTMPPESSTSSISIRFDKSHLSSIGERLYTQSLDLIRELVSNAYDADATKVNINLQDTELTISDDGAGMNREGIEQCFTIGSTYKKQHPVSPIHKRVRIGEFGIGKFAVLSLCDRFELFTRSKSYSATVIFDKQDFENKADWDVPIIEHAVAPHSFKTQKGTRVTLHDIKKEVSLLDLERYLMNLFPQGDRSFAIFINGLKLEQKFVPGDRFRIEERTEYGIIKGEIIISSLALAKEMMGIGIRVKGVLIKRETFEIESVHSLSTRRLTGEIRADFLTITTDRSDFIKDNKEYELFFTIINKKLKRIIKHLQKQVLSYQDKKSEKVLSDVLLMIRDALKKNSDIFLTGDLPLFARKKTRQAIEPTGESGLIATALAQKKNKSATKPEETSTLKNILKKAVQNLKPRLRGKIKTLLRDDRRIVKKVKIGGHELLVSFAHLGESEKESFVEGGIIFINRDHNLFKKIESKADLYFYHLLRLVSQELIKFAYPKNLDIAFVWQGRLINDAYMKIKEIKA